MADKKEPQAPIGAPDSAEAGEAEEVTYEAFEAEMERGTLQVTAKSASFEDTFTKESVEKFLLGDVTWAELMGLTMEEAYNIAEYGYSLYEESRYHDARTVFEALVLANPYDAYFHNILGAVYQQLDLRDEALEQYTIAIDMDEQSLHPYINRGELLLQMGELQEALQDFQRAVDLDKDGNDAATARARALVQATSTVLKGLEHYKKVTGKDPKKSST